MAGRVVAEKEISKIRGLLWPNEVVELTIKQKRLRPGGALITPTTFVVTNKRLIIIERDAWGLRSNNELIPFNYITGVRLDHGIFSSAVFVRVAGYSSEEGKFKRGMEEGEIHGITYSDAALLADVLNKKILEKDRKAEEERAQLIERYRQARPGLYVYCKVCGRRNDARNTHCKYCGAKLGR